MTTANVIDEAGEISTLVSEQPELPGDWPEPPPGIWPDKIAYGSKQPVRRVVVSFTGSIDLESGTPEDVAIAEKLQMGQGIWLNIEALGGKDGHVPVKGGVEGTMQLIVKDAVRTDEAAALAMRTELDALRRRFHQLSLAATFYVMDSEKTLPAPEDGETTTAARDSLARLRHHLEAGRWVPLPKERD